MRIKTNTLKSVRDFFDAELHPFFEREEIRFYFYWCCEHFLNLSKTQVISDPDFRISESMLLKFNFAIKDLKAHKPIQYVLGSCDFAGLRLDVTPDVLIPRPETEELVRKISEENPNFSGSVLDICTGSGCIALALKKQFPNANVQGLDISEKAIGVAKENARKNDLNVDFFVGDILDMDTISQKLDLIVSNPPYVRNSEKKQMQANVLDYEPYLALFVDDEDPLVFYRAIINFAQEHLNPKGKIYFEINENFGREIKEMMEFSGGSEISVCRDFRGKERFVVSDKLKIYHYIDK